MPAQRAVPGHLFRTSWRACAQHRLLAFLILLQRREAGFTPFTALSHRTFKNDLGRNIRDRIHRQYLEVGYNYIRQRQEGEMLNVLAIESWAVPDTYHISAALVINATSMLVG